jgi:hypothetical protein
MYVHADLTLQERALERTTPIGCTPGRYRPPDKLLAFLSSSPGALLRRGPLRTTACDFHRTGLKQAQGSRTRRKAAAGYGIGAASAPTLAIDVDKLEGSGIVRRS